MNSFKKAINIDLNESRLILSATNQIHKYSFIFLHGIGMNIQKFFEVFLSKDLIGLLDDFKIIIPQAPIRPVAMWQGKLDYSWYNKDDISTVRKRNISFLILSLKKLVSE
jgi:Phospholipase/Carboxylesterase.